MSDFDKFNEWYHTSLEHGPHHFFREAEGRFNDYDTDFSLQSGMMDHMATKVGKYALANPTANIGDIKLGIKAKKNEIQDIAFNSPGHELNGAPNFTSMLHPHNHLFEADDDVGIDVSNSSSGIQAKENRKRLNREVLGQFGLAPQSNSGTNNIINAKDRFKMKKSYTNQDVLKIVLPYIELNESNTSKLTKSIKIVSNDSIFTLNDTQLATVYNELFEVKYGKLAKSDPDHNYLRGQILQAHDSTKYDLLEKLKQGGMTIGDVLSHYTDKFPQEVSSNYNVNFPQDDLHEIVNTVSKEHGINAFNSIVPITGHNIDNVSKIMDSIQSLHSDYLNNSILSHNETPEYPLDTGDYDDSPQFNTFNEKGHNDIQPSQPKGIDVSGTSQQLQAKVARTRNNDHVMAGDIKPKQTQVINAADRFRKSLAIVDLQALVNLVLGEGLQKSINKQQLKICNLLLKSGRVNEAGAKLAINEVMDLCKKKVNKSNVVNLSDRKHKTIDEQLAELDAKHKETKENIKDKESKSNDNRKDHNELVLENAKRHNEMMKKIEELKEKISSRVKKL